MIMPNPLTSRFVNDRVEIGFYKSEWEWFCIGYFNDEVPQRFVSVNEPRCVDDGVDRSSKTYNGDTGMTTPTQDYTKELNPIGEVDRYEYQELHGCLEQ